MSVQELNSQNAAPERVGLRSPMIGCPLSQTSTWQNDLQPAMLQRVSRASTTSDTRPGPFTGWEIFQN
jgi:hypothetical protein